MVTATPGVLLKTDIPIVQYLKHLNEKQAPINRFITRILDDTHVWIKSDRLEWVLHEVRVFNEANVYTPPVVLGGGASGDEDEDGDDEDGEEQEE